MVVAGRASLKHENDELRGKLKHEMMSCMHMHTCLAKAAST